tara:strand:+ start:3445 stop:5694 length:2250 start_codon:yes stop_codon:yes gene_type:complete
MPIILTNTTFRDVFLTSRNFLQSNVGDSNIFSLEFDESIQATSSISNYLTNNPTTDIIEWIGGSWLDEGFRNGDTISIVVYTISTGVVIDTINTTIDWINDEQMKVAQTTASWYSFPDSVATIYVTGRKRQGMTLNANMVGNGSEGSEYSVIDGQVTGFYFDLTTAGPIYYGAQYGLRSGMFATTATLTETSSTTSLRKYNLRIEFIQSGLYNSANYDFDNCLKLYARMNWESLLGEPFNNTQFISSLDANTGWFNQAFNTGIIDSTLVQGIQEIAFDSPTIGTFVVESTSAIYAVGSAYVSGDDSYYKNVPNSQSYLSLNIPTQVPVLGTPIASYTILGRNYTLEITSVIQVGNQYTFNFIFTPNPAFKTWVTSLAVGNQTMYIWCRIGDVNLLVFSGQMTSAPAVTKELNLVVANFIDHADNTTNSVVLSSGYSGNVEDDLAFIGKVFLRNYNDTTYIRVGIEAYNFNTDETFTLQQSNLSLLNIPQVNGIYPVNATIPINSELPTTSEKINALIVRDTSLDTALGYGVKIYYPFLLNWRYWLAQTNANSDFYPNLQTQNWVPYGNTDDWRLRLNLEMDINAENYQFLDEVGIKDYDTEPNVIQQVQIYREIDLLTEVNVIIEGELMRIVGQNITANGVNWEQATVWGMITIEPTESSPRWICSTILPFDLNTQNPLSPLAGLFCSLTFPTPDVARLECAFDPSKINLNNGVKFTLKIKGCTDGAVNKLTTTGVAKRTTDGNNKIKT